MYCARAHTSCYEEHSVRNRVFDGLGAYGAIIGQTKNMCSYLIKSHIRTMPRRKKYGLVLAITRVLVA